MTSLNKEGIHEKYLVLSDNGYQGDDAGVAKQGPEVGGGLHKEAHEHRDEEQKEDRMEWRCEIDELRGRQKERISFRLRWNIRDPCCNG